MDTEQATVPYGYCHCGCGEKTRLARKTDRAIGHVRGAPLRFIAGHGARRSPEQRFRKWVGEAKAGGCWPWRGTIADNGYGRLSLGYSSVPAHRFSYELHVGTVPEGHVLDHLCHTRDASCPGGSTCPHRRCVNPVHLEPVPHPENCRRGVGTKLTPGDITAIRCALAGGTTQGVLAMDYGVAQSTISRIGSNARWAD